MLDRKRRDISVLGLGFLLVIAGCGGGSSSGGGGGGGTTGSAATSVYVTQSSGGLGPVTSSILQFSRTSNGSAAPTATITGPAGIDFHALTVDGTGNLYVGGQIPGSGSPGSGGAEILVYAPGASGNATPTRTITGVATGLQALSTNSIQGMTSDGAGNIYLLTAVEVGSGPSNLVFQGISVFAATANGNVAPTKVIAGAAAPFFNPTQIAVDSAGNLYVANGAVQGPGSVLIFNSSATGNVTPASTLAGSNTTIFFAQGVALDSVGNIYVASLGQNTGPTGGTLSGTPSILVFSAGATGNVTPMRTISGAATTMEELGNLRVDSVGNIYVLSHAGGSEKILKFAPGATGNVAPIGTITSAAFFDEGGSIALQ